MICVGVVMIMAVRVIVIMYMIVQMIVHMIVSLRRTHDKLMSMRDRLCMFILQNR